MWHKWCIIEWRHNKWCHNIAYGQYDIDNTVLFNEFYIRSVLELIYFSNGVCDANCNKFECLWDNHDCDDIEPKWPKYRDGRESYHQSVDFTQLVLDRKFETKVTNRTWNPHMPFMLDKRILEDISTELPIETSLTRYAISKNTDFSVKRLINWILVHIKQEKRPICNMKCYLIIIRWSHLEIIVTW